MRLWLTGLWVSSLLLGCFDATDVVTPDQGVITEQPDAAAEVDASTPPMCPPNCPPGTQCDAATGACVAIDCGEDADCPAGTICQNARCGPGCDPQTVCPPADGQPTACDPVSGRCAPQFVCCAADSACSVAFERACAGRVDYDAGSCEPNPCGCECAGDGDCPTGRICADCACIVACAEPGGACPPGERCDPASGCVSGCETDAHCPAGRFCDSDQVCRDGCRDAADCDGRPCNLGVCLECADSADCGAREWCDFGQCRDGCRDDDACRVTGRCVEGRCEPCAADADCAADRYCDASGACVDGCRDDAGCPGDLRCADGICVDCLDDDACAAGTICGADGVCVDGCRDDAECPDGVCVAGVCVACRDDGPCAAGEFCAEAGRCEDGCRDDAGCGPGTVCVEGVCTLPCVDDPFEEDDAPDLASAIEPVAVIDDRVLCPDDRDLYAVEVPADAQLVARVTWPDATEALDVRILAGDAIAAGVARQGGVEATWAQAGPVLVEVTGAAGGRTAYTLETRVVPIGGCVPDVRDPGDDVVAGATRVPAAGGRWLGRICPMDLDWFVRTMRADDGLEVVLEWTGDPLALVVARAGAADAPERVLDLADDLGDGRWRIRWAVAPGADVFAAGDWVFGVRGRGADATADYTLSLAPEAADCDPAACPQGGPCDRGVCDGDGRCALIPAPDGVACDDGDACNGLETCLAGQCVPGRPQLCETGFLDPCARTVCARDVGCIREAAADGAPCPDADPCNGAETCQGGACSPGAEPLACAGDVCNAGRCEPGVGCVLDPLEDGTPCANDDVCDGDEACVDGACRPGEALVCGAPDPCVDRGCDAEDGCFEAVREDGTPCDDDDVCNGREVCGDGACLPGEPPVCGESDACMLRRCDPQLGCVEEPRENGTPCDDADLCNGRETCQSGVCVPGEAPECAGADACNQAVCDPVTGCGLVPLDDGTACGDGDACNGAETCQAGVCTPGAALDCGVSDECADRACDPAVGCTAVALNEGGACNDDGDRCTGVSVCQAGACAAIEPPPDCGESDGCMARGCDPAGGCFERPINEGAVCDDGDVCNGESVCRAGACSPGAGPLDCGVSDGCMERGCDPEGGCFERPINEGGICDDGNVCNGQSVCVAGACTADAGPLDCGVSDGCMERGCDPEGGCFERPINEGGVCDDGNVCNGQSVCVAGACTADAGPLDCGVSDGCMERGCDPAGGCFERPINEGARCDGDGDVCNGTSTCQAGACQPAQGPLHCGATDECMERGCDAANGCFERPRREGQACQDNGNVCDGVNLCRAGQCAIDAQPAPNCGGTDECMERGCEARTGCFERPRREGQVCQDNANVCDGVNLCRAGRCSINAQPAPNCGGTDECMERGCEARTGCFERPRREGQACQDNGNVCDGVNLCRGGRCAGNAIPPPACGNSDECMQRGCDARNGCFANPVNNGARCQDNGNACDGINICDNGACAINRIPPSGRQVLNPGGEVGETYNTPDARGIRGVRFDCDANTQRGFRFCMPQAGVVRVDLRGRVNGAGNCDDRADWQSCLQNTNQRRCQRHEQVCALAREDQWDGVRGQGAWYFVGCSRETNDPGRQPATCDGDIGPLDSSANIALNEGNNQIIVRQKCDATVEGAVNTQVNCGCSNNTQSMRLRQFYIRR